MKRKTIIIIIALLLAMLLTGCTHNNGNSAETADPQATENASATDAPNTVEGAGRIYTRDFAPEDVVTDESGRMEYIRNEILLVAKMDASFDEVKALIESLSGELVGCIELTGDYQVAFTNKTEQELNDLIAQFKASPLIDDATLNYIMHTSVEAASVSDPWGGADWSEGLPEDENWGVEAIRAREAWSHASEMKDINIGIIDSGFQYDHEDLVNVIAWNLSDTVGEHGTHVLGTFAAQANNGIGVSGVFPNRINGETPAADAYTAVISDVASMIRYKEVLVDLIIKNVKVINISKGFNEWEAVNFAASVGEQSAIDFIKSLSDPIGESLHRLLLRGYDFVICQSAGNNSSTNLLNAECYVKDENQRFGWRYAPEAPLNSYFGKLDAKYNSPITAIDNHQDVVDRIIVVGAVRNKGVSLLNNHRGYAVCYFSNWGDRLDILAPGYDIYSCVPENSYENGEKWSGTSMAAPHVSGTAAMVWAVNPALSGAEVKQIICGTTGVQIVDTFRGADGILTYDDVHQTNGLLDAAAAVEAAIAARDSGAVPDFEEKEYGIVITSVLDDETGLPFTKDEEGTAEKPSVLAYPVENGLAMPDCAASAEADDNGEVVLFLVEGDYELDVDMEGYEHYSVQISIKANESKQVSPIRLTKLGQRSTKTYATGYFSYFLTKDGRLFKYGYGPSSMVVKQFDDGIIDFAAQYDKVYAIKEDKSLWEYKTDSMNAVLNGKKKILDDVESVSVGYSLGFALKSDGSLWGWGGSSYNGAYVGTGEQRVYETPVFVMDDVTEVYALPYQTYVIKKDGSLWGWGSNDYYCLGDGTRETRYSPVKILDDVKELHYNWSYTYAIKNDGSLWGMGSKSTGKTSGTEDRLPVKIMDDVVDIQGYDTMFVIKSDGSLWGWGWNKYGQLGDGTAKDKTDPVFITDNVREVYPGTSTYAIKRDGSLWGWGWNGHGNLGDGTKDPRLTPVHIIDYVKKVCADGYMVFAILEDGTLLGWGNNEKKQLGSQVPAYQTAPLKLADGVADVQWGYCDGESEEEFGEAFLAGDIFMIKKDGSVRVHDYNGWRSLIQAADSEPAVTPTPSQEHTVTDGVIEHSIWADFVNRKGWRDREELQEMIDMEIDSGVISHWYSDNGHTVQYFLEDLDSDGVQELVIAERHWDINTDLTVWKYNTATNSIQLVGWEGAYGGENVWVNNVYYSERFNAVVYTVGRPAFGSTQFIYCKLDNGKMIEMFDVATPEMGETNGQIYHPATHSSQSISQDTLDEYLQDLWNSHMGQFTITE